MAQSRIEEHRADHGLRTAYGLAIAMVIAAGYWALRVLLTQYGQ